MSIQFSIAGTSPVNTQKNRKIVNFNLSHIIKSHFDYAQKLPEILNAVGIRITPRSKASSNDLKAYCEKQEAKEKELAEKLDQNLHVDSKSELSEVPGPVNPKKSEFVVGADEPK